MSERIDPIYCGAGWVKEFENGGKVVKIVVSLDDIPDHFIQNDEYGRQVWLQVGSVKNVKAGEGAMTHTVQIDQWRSAKAAQDAPRMPQSARPAQDPSPESSDDDLPF